MIFAPNWMMRELLGLLAPVTRPKLLEAKFELRFFPVERRDLMQGPIEVVDAGSVEEIPTGIAQGERSRRGEAGRIEVVVRSTAACARGAYVGEHTVTRIEDLDRSHGVRTIPARIELKGKVAGCRDRKSVV